jgi:hypothetical protein
MPVPAQQQTPKDRAEYDATVAEVKAHLVDGQWIDDDPRSPGLLRRQWSLAAAWVSDWLDAHQPGGIADVRAALVALAPDEKCEAVALNDAAFLIEAPGPIGNVFIIARSGSHFRLAWSIADPQQTTGKQGQILAAWRAENARHGGHGAYWAASGRAGPIIPRIAKLPDDAAGNSRFYIDGLYAQSAGGTVGAQISIWLWNGITAHALAARDYTVMIDQKVGTRLEGNLLKVQEKKFFRAFFSCGSCEERQTDWIVRVAEHGIEDLGEVSAVPELDAVDEMLYRLIRGKPVTDLGTPAAIGAAKRLINEARAEQSPEDWKKFPTLGMMMLSRLADEKGGRVLCLGMDWAGTNIFRLRTTTTGFFITSITAAPGGCEQ